MHVLYSFIIKYIQIAGAEIDVQTFKKPLSPKEEAYFLKLCKEGDPRARKTLIEYNMRLVAHIAKKYNGSHENDDLISAGTIGLIKAIDTYDSKKGKRLVTYASRCIENELLMLLRQNRKHAREVSLFEPIGTDKEGNEISLMDIISPDTPSILDSMVHDYNLEQLPGCMLHHLTNRKWCSCPDVTVCPVKHHVLKKKLPPQWAFPDHMFPGSKNVHCSSFAKLSNLTSLFLPSEYHPR